MDPPLVNEASFTAAANPSSYSLAGLLSFPADGGASGMGMRGGPEESTPTELGGAKRGRDVNLKSVSPIVPNQDSNGLNGKRTKLSEPRDERTGVEANSILLKTVKPEPPRDYIHVRARRGQATDSHSLAERARREKISERMKILQDLVPGCNKVIGKALVLDEIINYIQSLQHQVEFLSMKLEAVTSTSRMNPTMEDFPLKDLTAQAFDASALFYGLQNPGDYTRGSQVEWLHMHVGSDFNRAT